MVYYLLAYFCLRRFTMLQVTMNFEEPTEKRRRMDVLVDYGHGVDIQMLQHENLILKQQMQELKKQVWCPFV